MSGLDDFNPSGAYWIIFLLSVPHWLVVVRCVYKVQVRWQAAFVYTAVCVVRTVSLYHQIDLAIPGVLRSFFHEATRLNFVHHQSLSSSATLSCWIARQPCLFVLTSWLLSAQCVARRKAQFLARSSLAAADWTPQRRRMNIPRGPSSIDLYIAPCVQSRGNFVGLPIGITFGVCSPEQPFARRIDGLSEDQPKGMLWPLWEDVVGELVQHFILIHSLAFTVW